LHFVKKIFIALMFVFMFLQANCQTKYSFGIMASPDWTYINGSFNYHGGDRYTTVPGYCVGISIYKKISKHFFWTTGIGYTSKGTKTFLTFIVVDNNFNPIDTVPGTSTHKYRDLDIPILLNYKLGNSKLQFTCSFGVVLGFALKEWVTDELPSFTNIWNYKSNKVGPDRINLNLGIGAMYRFNEKYTIMIEPNYKIDVRAIAETLMDDSHSFGIRTTLIYKFKY